MGTLDRRSQAGRASTGLAAGLRELGATPLHSVLGTGVVAIVGSGLPWAVAGFVAGATREAEPAHRVGIFALSVFAIDTARSSLPGGLPWILLGQAQWTAQGVAQLAVLGGVPLVSAVIAAVNAAIAAAISPGKRESRPVASRTAAAALVAYLAVAIFGLPVAERSRQGLLAPPVDSLALLVVQPDLPAADRWSPPVQRTNLAIVARQTAQALASARRKPDLVLWPETTVTNAIDEDEELRAAVLERVDALGVPVVFGGVRSSRSGDPRQYRNTAFWVAPERGIVDAFDKTRAIPVVESATVFPGRGVIEALLGLAEQPRHVEEASTHRPLHGSAYLAVVLCFEAIFPRLVAARRTPETAAIVNLANDSWFASEAPSLQQVAFASFRAIEQRLWLVRVAHGGVSAVIDPYGRVVDELPFGERGSLRAAIVPAAHPSTRERLALGSLLFTGGAVGSGLALPFTRRSYS
jgi:apolipoprotein N-acyltransferase